MVTSKKGTKATKAKNPAVPKTKAKAKEPSGPRLVTYVLDTTASKGGATLSVPYAIAINGKFPKEFESATERVGGKRGKIKVLIPPKGATAEEKAEFETKATKVSLYLNSDARDGKAYRKHPVYEVTLEPKEGFHVVVQIKEKLGKNADEPKLGASTFDQKTNTKTFKVALTGDIWMLVSHKYDAKEAEEILADKASAEVKDAVLRIYKGLTATKMTLEAPAPSSGGEPRKIDVAFDDAKKDPAVPGSEDSNPRGNINNGYTLPGEGLTRVHPGAFAALFTAAIDSGVDYVRVASNWRPCLGSIVHRAGLGLDVGAINTLKIDRSQLLTPKAPQKKPPIAAHGNVAADEQVRFRAFEAARNKTKERRKQLDRAIAEDRRVLFETAPMGGFPMPASPSEIEDAELAKALVRTEREKAHHAWQVAARVEREALEHWRELGDAREPSIMHAFRDSLAKNGLVAQLFDPWLMDGKTGDAHLAPNTFAEGNEVLHDNHLHITAKDTKILFQKAKATRKVRGKPGC